MSNEREREETDAERLMWEYTEATRRLDALRDQATSLGERFQRLADGLTAHPRRLIVGLPDQFLEDPEEWDIVPSHPLPRIETLAALTTDIREAALIVEQLRERLILMGRGELVEQPDAFFR